MSSQQLDFFQSESSRTWSVSEVNAYLRELMESDFNLQDLRVEGEVSNLSRPRSGHIYFTLKDADSSLRCVMWRNIASYYGDQLEEGKAVEARGAVSVYEKGGQYQLYVQSIRSLGKGDLYQQFLDLKEKLEQEGLFAPEHKRKIPSWPKHLGIVTSATGAALQDMLNTLRRRYPLLEVVLAPAAVQGDSAPPEIMRALDQLNQITDLDVILLGRGGGSIEDLWAFNDEGVARAVFNSRVPVISGVGHETDFTITDFTADVRAPTPTAAAELAVPDQVELRESIRAFQARLGMEINEFISDHRWTLTHLRTRLDRSSPRTVLQSDRQRVDENTARLEREMERTVKVCRTAVGQIVSRLGALDPRATISRGYAIVTDREGTRVRSVTQVHFGDKLRVHVADGDFDVRVEEKE
jgi:exodeoxyribonuclease VII large subunit